LVIRFTRRLGVISLGVISLGAAIAALCPLSILPHAVNAYTADQQQACAGDAFRLCSADIPDVDRITARMIRNKSQLSPECRVFFRSGPERDADAAGRPSRQGPRSPHHIRKSRPDAS
jgi:hypothetical protein